MPDDSFFGQALVNAVKAGNVTQARVDDMTLRILTAMFQVGIFDQPQTGDLSVDSRSAEHTRLARHLSATATVLVKNNENILPINKNKVKTIAIIGDDGRDKPVVAGDGSGHVIPESIVTPFDGIAAKAGSHIKVTYAPSNPIDNAVKVAAAADIAIVFVATISGEGEDRATLALPDNQDALVAAVAAAQPNTVVVVHTPGAVLMPWEASVPGILVAFMPGQEDGNAIADVLFGNVNPSARLPVTFPLTNSQTPLTTPAQYPGINDQATYSEKLLVGYRWYDAAKVTPLFPFGHGLSYATFQYFDLHIVATADDVTVNFRLQNTGLVPGTEVPQLYLGFPAIAEEPPKQLRGFQKVKLTPGETQHVSFTIYPSHMSIWDVHDHKWKPVQGRFTAFVGSSSRDIRLLGSFDF